MTIISRADVTQLLLAVQEVSPSPPGPGRSSEMCAEGMSHGGPGTTTQCLHETCPFFFIHLISSVSLHQRKDNAIKPIRMDVTDGTVCVSSKHWVDRRVYSRSTWAWSAGPKRKTPGR